MWLNDRWGFGKVGQVYLNPEATEPHHVHSVADRPGLVSANLQLRFDEHRRNIPPHGLRILHLWVWHGNSGNRFNVRVLLKVMTLHRTLKPMVLSVPSTMPRRNWGYCMLDTVSCIVVTVHI